MRQNPRVVGEEGAQASEKKWNTRATFSNYTLFKNKTQVHVGKNIFKK